MRLVVTTADHQWDIHDVTDADFVHVWMLADAEKQDGWVSNLLIALLRDAPAVVRGDATRALMQRVHSAVLANESAKQDGHNQGVSLLRVLDPGGPAVSVYADVTALLAKAVAGRLTSFLPPWVAACQLVPASQVRPRPNEGEAASDLQQRVEHALALLVTTTRRVWPPLSTPTVMRWKFRTERPTTCVGIYLQLPGHDRVAIVWPSEERRDGETPDAS